MVRRTFPLSLLAALLLLVPTSFASARLDGIIPLTLRPPVSAVGGQTVHFVVTLSGEAVGNEVIDVDATAGAFSYLPSTVTPEPGASTVTITGILSQNPGQQVTVIASIEEASAGATMCVPDEIK